LFPILLAKKAVGIRLSGMDKTLAELIKISRFVGKNAEWTQGGSGNTSVKTADRKFMYIKASGTALKDMNAKKGWRKINLQKARRITGDKKNAERLNVCCEDNTKENRPPSIETNLHILLGRYVIHLHPVMVCAFLISKNGKAELEKLFADEKAAPLWVSYAKPGYCLAKKISGLCRKYQKKYRHKPKILFVERHGLFVSAASTKEALKLAEQVINKCEAKINALPKRRRLNREKIIALCAAHDI
jgi:rhamnose utilization protein RhaD (predicted bifunctional aldolase and dehydrogenase)